MEIDKLHIKQTETEGEREREREHRLTEPGMQKVTA